MEYKIALLLKEHYYRKINEQLKTRFEDVKLEFYSYNTLQELNDTFSQMI